MCLDNRQNFRNIKIIFRNMMFLIDSCTIIQANTQMTLTLHFLSLISLTVVRKSISRSSKSVERKRVWYIQAVTSPVAYFHIFGSKKESNLLAKVPDFTIF